MANTTNLNLEKPIGTDQALVSVINSNMDKIDTFAGSTNQAFANKFANLGTLSASTESDFFTAVVNQIKTYANGTYVFSATWQSNSAYIITASKVSDTRIIGSAVPQMQNGKDMVGFSYEGTTLNLYQIAARADWTGASAYKEQIEASAVSILQMLGKFRTLSFQGVSRAHTENEVLMTLPSEHRPIGGNAIFTVGTVGTTPVIIRLNGSNGQITVYVANNAGTGRIYFNMSWVVA